MACSEKLILSRKDRQGHQKTLKASDLSQCLTTGQTQSAPVSLGRVFHGKRLAVDRNGRAHLLPSIPDPLAVFQHLMDALLSQAVFPFPDIGSEAEVDPLKRILAGITKLDADNYTTSDPESLKREMIWATKPGLMSDVLGLTSKKEIETSGTFFGSIQKVLPKEEKGTSLEIRELVKSEGDALADTRDRMGSTLLHHAALFGDFDLAEKMIAIRDSVNKLDRTALHMAALVGDREMVELLADSKDIDTRDMFGKSSLYLAAENGHTEIVSYLMELGAEPDIVDMFGLSPLFASIRGGWFETVKLLMSKDVDVNRQCKIGATPIHFAALSGNIEIVRVLLDKGAKANLVDKLEATPLMLATRGGHFDVCLKLLEVYTADDIMKTNMEGLQAIHYAVATSNLELVKTLIENGADTVATISEIGVTLLHFAVLYGNHAIVTYLVKEVKVDVNTADKGGSTPLHDAIRANDADVVELLLDSGAAVNLPDKHGIQAIHCAMVCNVDMVKTLIKNKADLDARTENGWTPLHVAVLFGNHPVVSFLVEEANVDVNVVDQMKYSPMDLAEMNGDEEFISLLKQHGGRRGQRKKVPATGTEKQTSAFPQVAAAADVSAVPQTQPEIENPGPCSVATDSGPSTHEEDPRLRPILTKVDVAKMVNDLEKLLKDAGAEVLTQKNIIFSQRNFTMGVIGPKGGRLAFGDESVTMTIPPGALSDTRVISCFRPISLNDDDQGRQPNKDWIFCTPELICGPDGTKFNAPITIRFRHSVHVREDGSCRGQNVRVVTKGDNEEEWQGEAGGIQFDGRWVSINIAHFTSVSCAIPRQEARRDDDIPMQEPHHDADERFDILMSTGLTVVPQTLPRGSTQAYVPGTPTHLHVFITLADESHMQDLKHRRLMDTNMPNNEVSRRNRMISSINPLLDLFIEGHAHDFELSNGNIITVQLRQMAGMEVTHNNVPIAAVTLPTSPHKNIMLILEPDQSDGSSKSVIEHKVLRKDHSNSVPRGAFTDGLSLPEKLERSRKHELSRTNPRRTFTAYPIEQGVHVSPQFRRLERELLQIQEEPELPPERAEQQVPVIPLADQIAVQLGQLADQVAALQAQYALLVDVENH